MSVVRRPARAALVVALGLAAAAALAVALRRARATRGPDGEVVAPAAEAAVPPAPVSGAQLSARGARPGATTAPPRPAAPDDPFLRDDDGAAIRGHVRDAAGRPLAGVRVEVEGHAYLVLPTDDAGRFQVSGPEPGPARLVLRWGHFSSDAPPALVRDLDVAPGPAVTRVDLVVDPVPSIEGVVVGPDGRSRGGVGLDLVRTGTSVSDAVAEQWLSSYFAAPPNRIRLRSAADGTFRFLGVPEGLRFDVVWWDDETDERVGARGLAAGARGVRIEVAARHGVVARCVDAASGDPVTASVTAQSLSLRRSSQEASLAQPPDEGVRARPGERLRLVAQAAGYAPAVVEHVVRGDVEMEEVVVRMERSPVHAPVFVGVVDERGAPWPSVPALAWSVGDTGVEVDDVTTSIVSYGAPWAGGSRYAAMATLPTGRFEVRPARDTVGLPTSGVLRFALAGSRALEVPLADEDALLDVALPRGGALRVSVVKEPGGAPQDPGDMTSLRATTADGTRVVLRLFRRGERIGLAAPARPPGEGTGAADAYETQALPPGPTTVHWTGGLHDGSPVVVSRATQVVAGEVTAVELVDPR